MKFATLFELRMRHDYYADGRCPDFDLAPAGETDALLRNHRASIRNLADGLRIVIATADSGAAFIPFAEGARFEFDVKLRNPDFPLFTDMRALAAQASPLYSNTTPEVDGVTELALSSRQAFADETLSVASPGAEEGFVLAGRPLAGVAVSQFQLSTPDAAPVPTPLRYEAGGKRLVLDTASASAAQVVNVRYPVRPPGPRDLFARIAIVADAAIASPATASALRVSFTAKHARWAYYCVTDLTQDVAAFSIVDTTAPGNAIQFGAGNRRDLNAAPDSDDTVAGDLAERYPQLRRIRFLSDEPVACRQAPRKGLELRLDGNVLPGTLPNPSIREFSTLPPGTGGGAAREDAVFRVLKVIGNSGV